MDLTKKSIKWLVAAIVVFALVLTAVFAAGNVATAKADSETPVAALVTATAATTDGGAGEYPNLLKAEDTSWTITALYYFDVPTNVELGEATFTFAPVLIAPDGTTKIRPASVNANSALVSLSNVARYVAGTNGSFAAVLDGDVTLASQIDGVDSNAPVAEKHLFEVTFVLDDESAIGAYTYALDATVDNFGHKATEFSLRVGEDDETVYLPAVSAAADGSVFYYRGQKAIPVVKDKTYTYSGEEQTFEFESIDADLTVTNNKRTDAGTQQVSVALPANYAWTDNTTAAKEFPFEILVLNVAKPVPAGTTYTYTGEAQTFAWSSTTDSDWYTISGDTETNADTYTVTVSLDDENTQWADGTTADLEFPFVINPMVVTKIDKTSATYTYDGTEKTFAFNGEVEEYYTITPPATGTDAGDYVVTIALKSKTNYVWDDETTADYTVTFTINVRNITKPVADTSVTYTYNGQEKTFAFTSESVVDSAWYTVSGDVQTNAYDSYTVTVSLDDDENTQWADGTTADLEYSFLISPMTVNKIHATGTYKYDGQQKDFVFDGEQQTAYYTITPPPVGTNAGDYVFTIALKSETNYKWNDNTTASYEETFTILPREISVAFAAESYTSVFDAPIATPSLNITGDEIIAGDADILDIHIEGIPEVGDDVDTYVLTIEYNDEYENYIVTVGEDVNYTITTLYIPVPVAADSTYTYTGSEQTFQFTAAPNSTYVALTNNVKTLPGTYTVTASLKDTANTAWATADPTTYTFVINAAKIKVTFVSTYGGSKKTIATNVEVNVLDPIVAPAIRFFKAGAVSFGGETVTTYAFEMDTQTDETAELDVTYTYNVKAGDANGDGYVTVADVLLMKNLLVGEYEEDDLLMDADDAWDAFDDGEDYALYTALDVNGSTTFRTNDIVAVREALVTGYDYKIVVEDGVQIVKIVQVAEVYDYDTFVEKVTEGYPVELMVDITAENERFDETLALPVDIDLNGKALTVEYFRLNTESVGVTFSIKGGTIYAFDDIVITAPNGNVKLDNVTGYNYLTDEVILAAATSSLHFENAVAFKKYPANSDKFANKIAALQTIAALSSQDEEEQAAAEEAFNAAALAEVSIPVDTHVVVEEAATLTVEQITVVEASNAQAEVKTFSIDVQSAAQKEKIKVDVTSKVSEEYVVEAVNQAGAVAKIDLVTDNEQPIAMTTGVKTHAELAAAVAEGGQIKLGANITQTAGLVVRKDVTIDMNGFSISRNSWMIDVNQGATLNLIGTGTINMTQDNKDQMAISLYGAENATYQNSSVVNVGENVTIRSKGYGVVIWQKSKTNYGYGAVANLAGPIYADKAATILGNVKQFDGDVVNGEPIDSVAQINVKGTAKFYTTSTAIYAAGFGKYTIEEGAYLEGGTALYIKSGYVNVAEGVTLKATMPAIAAYTYNGGGYYPTGDVVVIDNCYYPGNNAIVTIDENVTFIATAEDAQNVATYWAVETEAQLLEAINAGASYIALKGNVALSNTVILNGDLTLDLKSYNITANNVRALWIKSGNVSIIGNGTIYAGGATLNSASSVIRLGDGAANAAAANLTIGADVTISSDKCYGVTVFGYNVGSDVVGQTLTVYGTVAVTGGASAISGNGNSGLSKTAIVIEDGAAISATSDAAIYQPQHGTLLVKDGAALTGPTALFIKSGDVTVQDGAIMTATKATYSNYEFYGNGPKSTGDAIVIDNCYYPGTNAVVSIGENVVYSVAAEGAQNVATYWAVGTEAQLREAINAGASYIALKANIVLTDMVYIYQCNVIIDMNGHDITSDGYMFYIYYYGEMTFVGQGTIKSTDAIPFCMEGAPYSYVSDYGVLNIGENVTVEANNNYAIAIWEDSYVTHNTAYGIEVNVAGTINANIGITVLGNVAQHEGDVENGTPIETVAHINVKDTAVINGGGAAIYAAGFAQYTIEAGAYLEGDTALYIKSGYVDIATGAVIHATGVDLDYVYYGNGFYATGDAIVIDNCYYPGNNPVVTYSSALLDTVTVADANRDKVGSYWAVSTVSQLLEAKVAGASYIALKADITYNGQLSFGNDTTLDLNGYTIRSLNNVALSVTNGKTLRIKGNGNVIAQEMCAMAFSGSTLIIDGGTYTAYDNAVFGMNGSTGQGSNTIIINAGTFNGGIQTAGYVACGIYVANTNNVIVNGGTFNITNGVGILARSGSTTVGENVVFNMLGDNEIAGKVGDSSVQIPSGYALVIDHAANYPGGDPTLTNNSAYDVYVIE